MQRTNSNYQLIFSISFLMLGMIIFGFDPGIYFLQYLICGIGIVVIIIGLFILIKGISKIYHHDINKLLIIGGLVVTLIGALLSSLVWVFSELFSITIGIVFILYGLIKIICAIKDKHIIKDARFAEFFIGLSYIFTGFLFIIDSFLLNSFVDFILGLSLSASGLLGLTYYIANMRVNTNIINADSNDNSSFDGVYYDDEDDEDDNVYYDEDDDEDDDNSQFDDFYDEDEE